VKGDWVVFFSIFFFLIFFFFCIFFFSFVRNKLNVTTILSTSHLEDHSAANLDLVKALPGLRVLGFDKRVPGLTHLLRPNQLIPVGEQRVRALFTPGVTSGSGVFHILSARRLDFSPSPNRNPHSVLFSGDTLPVGGCGQFGLEIGVEKEMYNNLILQIGPLPGDTEIYCSHE
jgi:glyoxylase-like metal-dependent hydrolase (beta-lactamase superfamily II)